MARDYRPQRTPVTMTTAEVEVGAARIDASGYMLDDTHHPVYWDAEAEMDAAERSYLL